MVAPPLGAHDSRTHLRRSSRISESPVAGLGLARPGPTRVGLTGAVGRSASSRCGSGGPPPRCDMSCRASKIVTRSYPPAPPRSAALVTENLTRSATPACSTLLRAALMASWSRSRPSTVMCGYAWAMAMLDQPVPHAMSRTRAGGWARSRTSTSTPDVTAHRFGPTPAPMPAGEQVAHTWLGQMGRTGGRHRQRPRSACSTEQRT
jgi:hypothetical protein